MTKEQLNQHPAWAGERVEVRLHDERSHPRQCVDQYCSATFALGLAEIRGTISKHIRRLMKDQPIKH